MPHIALLEKNRRNLELMIDTLTTAGFTVRGFNDVPGLGAALVEEHFDAALIDAIGMDAEFAEACKALHEHGVPFTVVTAPRGPIDNERALIHGSAGTLNRPLTMQGLVNVMRSLSELSNTWQRSW